MNSHVPFYRIRLPVPERLVFAGALPLRFAVRRGLPTLIRFMMYLFCADVCFAIIYFLNQCEVSDQIQQGPAEHHLQQQDLMWIECIRSRYPLKQVPSKQYSYD